MRKIVFCQQARRELDEAGDWYEQERALRRDHRGHEIAGPARGVEKYLHQAHHDKPSSVFELQLSGDDFSELNGGKVPIADGRHDVLIGSPRWA